MKYKIVLGVLGVGVFFISLPQYTDAFSRGPKWYQNPWTTKYVDMDTYARNSAENQAMYSAMGSWSNAGARFAFVDDSQSGNYISYYRDCNTSTLAYNYIDTNKFGYISHTHIKVNTCKPWATNGDPNRYDFESVMTHELGHALRLYHTGFYDATMYETTQKGSTKKRSLYWDDINGIQDMYGTY